MSAPPRTVLQCSLDIRVGGEAEAVSCLDIVVTELEKLSTLSEPGGGGGGAGTEGPVEGGGGGGGGSSGGGCDDRRGGSDGSNLSILSS